MTTSVCCTDEQRTNRVKLVKDHCSSKFARYELPDDVIMWDVLPMTGTGKISKKDIREILRHIGYISKL